MAVTLEERLAASCRARYGLSIKSSNSIAWCVSNKLITMLCPMHAHMHIFRIILLRIPKTQKKPQHPSASEWLSKW